MAFNLFRKAQTDEGGEAKKPDQKKQMLLLLIIVALFGYIYFFTGIMRPGGEEKTAAEPAKKDSSAMVKQPIPKRDGGGPAEAEQPAPPKPAAVKPEVAKAPAAAPVKPEASKAPAAVKPPAPPKPSPPAPAKPAVSPPVAKAAPPVAKPATPPAKAAPPAKQAVAAVPATPAAADKPAKVSGKFTLLIGEFPEGKLLSEIKASIRKAGVGPLHVKAGKTTKEMHRLVVGEYAEHDQALAEVQKLKKKGVDAFMGEKGDKYVVYAGSYLYADRAEVERDRLLKLGMNASIVKNEITVRLAKVTAGTYGSTEKAQAAADKLKAKGLAADVIELGK
jgi:cell division septation protein DedD